MVQSAGPKEMVSELDMLYEAYWEFVLKENPTLATYLGDHRYDDQLGDFSEEAFHRRIDQCRKYLERLETLKKPAATGDQLNYELFQRELKDPIEESQFHPYVLPISQQSGPHVDLPQLITYHPFKTRLDYGNYISRLRQFPRLFDEIMENMKTGMRERIVPARIVVEKIVPQLEAHIVDEPGDSELHKPIANIPSSIPTQDRRRLEEELDEGVLGSVVPAYSKLVSFVKEEYLPASRSQVGIWALPRGKEWYAYSIRHFTTTNLAPAQIHKLGLQELARIQREIRAILKKVHFKSTLQEFTESVRNDKSNFYSTGEDLLNGFKAILQKMDGKLPLLFGRLPEEKYGFREIEAYRAEAAPAAYYYAPPEDRSRPGYFYVNTFKPETRPKYMMEALAYHEAVPGHHLQIAIQQELTGLPKFRRLGGYTSFVEGWALYAEELGKEVGFYQDVLSDFGRLTAEAWRAARLVVDTGIHDLKWTRERTIEFLRENTATSMQDIVSEVDRYIAWPGQALAYKIGQLKIRQLRAGTEKRLGRRFDIRKFHDELLSDGALPLDVLERKMTKWLRPEIKAQVRRKSRKKSKKR